MKNEKLDPNPQDPWATATYAGNEREQLRRWAKMSFTEKVRWLEKAHLLSIKLEKARKNRLSEAR